MRRYVILTALLAGHWTLLTGCRKPVHFPAGSMPQAAAAAGAKLAYDANHDGKADFFMFINASGRIDRIAYDRNGDQAPDQVVSLDTVRFQQARHLVIILDGYGYDIIKDYYDAGGLRLFHPPSRVIAPYPTMTDMCMEDLLGYVPCRSFEALYYDRKTNRRRGGKIDYLKGKNEPYNRLLQYRAGKILDAIGYLYPKAVFGKELNDAKRVFDRGATREILAYFVSSAGIGTKFGAAGQTESLPQVERLIFQVLYETRGAVKITLLADHGHSYKKSKRIPLESHLRKAGWRLVKRLSKPKDVVYIRFGLETYACFATNEPQLLSAELVKCEGVELASYAEKDTAVVLSPGGGRAVIRKLGQRYKYEPTRGDPLKLKGILAGLASDEAGYYDADALLKATAKHEYPAPLQRIWRAHFALVENTPDVIISLADGWFSGSKGFAGKVNVASTHGGLNYNNSTTFIMSTAGELPKLMRSADIPKHMSRLTGSPWPAKK